MSAAVQLSRDFARIQALPVREVTRARGEQLADYYTPLLVTPRGRTHSMVGTKEVAVPSRLNWLQGYAIHEFIRRKGGYFQLPVGTGKTLLTFLLPYIMDARRPVLVVPSNLVEKTRIEFSRLSRHWIQPEFPHHILGLKKLTDDSAVDLCARINSDLYLLDEVDRLSNQESSMSKRLARDIDERLVPVGAFTGTGGRFSILDISHLITWSLKEGAPVPLEERMPGLREVEIWASAIDENTPGDWTRGKGKKTQPGVLLRLIDASDDEAEALEDLNREIEEDYPGQGIRIDALDDLARARLAFRKRLRSTEGCIISDEDSCDKKLTIKMHLAPTDRRLEAAFKDFRLMRLPNGEVIEDSIVYWAQARNLGKGFFTQWIEPPPDWWNEPRKAYFKLCAKIIKRTAWSPNPLDTKRAVHREFPEHPIVKEWEEVKPQWEGETEPVWLSSSVAEFCAEWACNHHTLVWDSSIAFCEAVAELAGIPYFGEQGEDSRGRSIETNDGATSVVLSTGANLRGRNLQDRWHQNLLVGGVQSARDNEQLLGRTHRYQQTRDVVANLLLTSGDSLYSFDRARAEARFVLQTQGHRQKLLRAHIERVQRPSNSARWRLPN